MNLLLSDLLNLLPVRSPSDKINVCDLEQLFQDEVSTSVPIHKNCHDFFLGKIDDSLGNAGAVHCNSILDTVLEKIHNIGSSFHQDAFVGVSNARPGRKPV